MLQAS